VKFSHEKQSDLAEQMKVIIKCRTFGDIQVKEIAVEDSLHDAGHDGNPILETLSVIAVDPVDDVQSTVGSQSK